MGLTPEFKKFLYSLFPHCFSSVLPIGQEFNIVIKEVLPNIVSKILDINPDRNTSMNQLCFNLKKDCYDIIHTIPGFRRLILLLDNHHYVPGNKSLTEIKRDSSKKPNNKTWLNEEEYCKLRYEKNLKPDEFLIINEGENINKIDGNILWRDGNFRWIIHYLLTREFTKMSIPEGKELIIDDGLFYSPDDLKKLRKSILDDYNMNHNAISDYDKDCFFSFEIKNYYRFGYIYPDHKIHIKNSLGIGESDLKIPSHISKNNLNDSYLVITPDSDVIAILLFHIKSLVNPNTLTVDTVIYMDTQTAMDKAHGTIRETRFINITLLFTSIIDFFKQEYSGITYPVETMIFLFISYFSDYNESISPYLDVGPARLWNSFSLLHSTNKSKGGYPTFNQKDIKNNNLKRIDTPIPFIYKGESLLNDFLSIDVFNHSQSDKFNEFDEYLSRKDQTYFSNYFVFKFNEDDVVKFFCFVYQQSLIKKFADSGVLKSKSYIKDYNDLLSKAREYQITTTLVSNDTKKKNKNDVPEYCGLLSYNELLSRVRILLWTMNYYQNGWKSRSEFCDNYYLSSNPQQTISIHGWTLVKYDPEDKENSKFSISSNHVLKFKHHQINKHLPNSVFRIYNYYIVKRQSTVEDKTDPLLKKLLNI